jgi:hypothetical protein
MHPIFERLVAELRAWYLFEDRKEYGLRWELPGEAGTGHGRPGRHLSPVTEARPRLGTPAAVLAGGHYANGSMSGRR